MPPPPNLEVSFRNGLLHWLAQIEPLSADFGSYIGSTLVDTSSLDSGLDAGCSAWVSSEPSFQRLPFPSFPFTS